MAERKSGPVKPPVIDLTARETVPARETVAAGEARPVRPKAESKPETQPQPAAEDVAPAMSEATPQPDPAEEQTQPRFKPEPEPAARPEPRMPPPRPVAVLAMPWNAIAVAAAGGAVLGTLLTYLLGNLLPLPDTRPVIADPSARLEAQQASLVAFDSRIAALEEQTQRTQVSLDATIAQLDAGIGEVKASIAALPQPAAAPDLTPLETRLDTLESRLSAIGAGASPADAAAFSATLSQLEDGLTSLRNQLSTYDTRLSAQDGAIAAARSDVAAAKSAIAAQNQTLGGAEIAPAVRLPLVVTGIESAFATGRPFSVELSNLKALLPDLDVPQVVATAADTGLPRPDAVATQFAALVPTILAGRSGTSSGDFGQDALDWVKGLLAFRPAGEMEGDTPEAIVSRLEGAVGRRDFSTASSLFLSLPQPMQAAAGEVGGEITALGEAEGFIAGVRAAALKPVITEPQQ
jgi:hypothetical protein